jgi:hypothetical protein
LCHSTVYEQKLGKNLGSSEFENGTYTWWLLSIISCMFVFEGSLAHGFCARFWRTSSLLATIVYTKLRTIVHSCHHHIYNISWAFFLSCLYKNLWLLRQSFVCFLFPFLSYLYAARTYDRVITKSWSIESLEWPQDKSVTLYDCRILLIHMQPSFYNYIVFIYLTQIYLHWTWHNHDWSTHDFIKNTF